MKLWTVVARRALSVSERQRALDISLINSPSAVSAGAENEGVENARVEKLPGYDARGDNS